MEQIVLLHDCILIAVREMPPYAPPTSSARSRNLATIRATLVIGFGAIIVASIGHGRYLFSYFA